MMRLAWRKVVWSAGLLALFNCSGDTEPRRGQLMLALQTDMSIPKDVNRIRLQVLVGDTLQHDQTYPVAPEPNGSKLPATLAIVAGEDKNPTVQVRVVGIREESNETLARTFAKVVTTVPTSRIATLRVPIQWLCDGTAREEGDGYASTCQSAGDDGDVEDERSCVAGECKPVLVDSALLPDYAPEDIFGGDPGPDGFSGVCFDTEGCFDAGFEAVPDAACELALDVPDNREVNVALQFPLEIDGQEGTGICGDEACYVPLDQDDTFGWSMTGSGGAGGEGSDPSGESAGGAGAERGRTKVKLPRSVCERIDEGTVEAVRVTYACQTKTPRYPTCGEWSAVENPPGGGVGGSSSTDSSSTTTGGSGGTSVVGQCASLTGEVVDTGDPDIDEYVSAVRQLLPVAEQYRDMTERACAGLLHQTVVGDLDDQELVLLCQDASSEVQTVLATGALHAVLAEGYCVSDMGAQQACEERCGVTALCGEEPDSRCSEFVGDCESGSSCEDGCYGTRDTPTACAGDCFGECTGTCSGRCTLRDGTVAVDGCPGGMCQGTCNGVCAGNCLNTEACDTTCLATEPADVCGGDGTNITCRAPLSAELCAEDICAVSCELSAAATRTCRVSIVSTYPSAAGEGEPISTEDRTTLEMNLGPLADVVLQTQGLDSIIAHLSTAVSAIGEQLSDDPNFLEPEALQCFSEAVTLHTQAINALQVATTSSAAVVSSFYFTDVSIPANGTGGNSGTGGTGGVGGFGGVPDGGSGGVGGVGGASGSGGLPPGGSAGEGSGGSSAGGSSGDTCSSTVACTSDAQCGGGVCPLGSCDVALTACGNDAECPEDSCVDFYCSVTGFGCENDSTCSGPDTCSPRFCDCGAVTGGAGAGGVAGASGTGGVGGAGGIGGSSTTSGPDNCGWGPDPAPCEICLSTLCCSSSTACDEDPFCGPVASPYSQLQCVVSCQGSYGFPTSECEASCGVDGVLADTTFNLLSCGSECSECNVPPIGTR